MVESLPKGLVLHGQVLRGVIDHPGTYRVRVSVKNSEQQTLSADFDIVCGQTICLTPPMGWNSWYCWSESVSQKHIQTAGDLLVRSGLADYGWQYANIDDCWQHRRGGPTNAIIPNHRFTDMAALCEHLHRHGLRAGIYSTPWISSYSGFIGSSATSASGDYADVALPEDRRPQPAQFFGRYPSLHERKVDRVGAHWFFDRDIQQIAQWGFDFIKMDWNPNDVATTARIADDIARCGRDIVLSLSNATPFENMPQLAQYAHCWRTTHDIQDTWASLRTISFSQQKWQPFTRPGTWNDPDMLQLGRLGNTNSFVESSRPTRLTYHEQRMQFSLWCLLSAPLILSCHLHELDSETLELLTNDNLISVNQDPDGAPAEVITCTDDIQIWRKPLSDGHIAVGLFNTTERREKIQVQWKDLGISGHQRVQELWSGSDLGVVEGSISLEVAPHGAEVLKISGYQ